MSDLVERLRDSKGWPPLGNAAADRIIELEAHRDELLEVLRGEEDRGHCLSPTARAAIAKCEAKP